MSEVMRPRGFCQVTGCGKPSTFQMVYADTPKGSQICVPASVVMTGWTMRSGYEFAGWLERCTMCATLEQAHMDHVRWRRANPGVEYDPGELQFMKLPFCDVRSHADFCAFFGVKTVGEAIAKTMSHAA